MNRRFVSMLVGIVSLLFGVGLVAQEARAPNADEKKATLACLHSLQKESGGFAADAKAESPATLPATSSAVRAIKYFGGEVKNRDKCAAFIASCRKDGGYSPTPDGKPDVRTTAVGIMAALEISNKTDLHDALSFLEANSKSFDDIRIAAAAFDTVKQKPNQLASWLAEVERQRNPDGSYGKGARDTASCAVTVLRLGGKLDSRERVLQVLKGGQRPDGGWAREGEASDLETTYRVMRAFYMLKEKPDVAACRKFVASCRNADGSYSVLPNQPGNVSPTYFASIVSHWLDGMK